MGLKSWLSRKAADLRSIAISTLGNPSKSLLDLFNGGVSTFAGVTVNEPKSLQVGTYLTCIKILAESIASLPLNVYERTENGKNLASDYPLYDLLHNRPNPEMSSFSFRETLQGHLCMYGNAYAEIDYGAAGYRPLALWPLLPDRTWPERDRVTGEIVYKTRDPFTGEILTLSAWRVLHIPGLGFDGLMGYSPVQLLKETLGLALGTEQFGSAFFGNGARPGGVLEHPAKLSDQAYKHLKESWNEKYQGLSNAHRLAILEEGMKYSALTVPPDQAQFLETRKFQKSEIASWFRIPLHMIGDMDRATGGNIEHQSIEFMVHTLRSWLVRWEQIINYKLIGVRERKKYFVEFKIDGFMRGDAKSRNEAYAIAKQNGWMCADDIRELENMNPLPNGQGKIYSMPMNQLPADKVEEYVQAIIDRNKTSNKPQQQNQPEEQPGGVPSARRDLNPAMQPLFFDMAVRICKRYQQDAERGKHDPEKMREFIKTVLWPACEATRSQKEFNSYVGMTEVFLKEYEPMEASHKIAGIFIGGEHNAEA